jgi:hypothetical protein
MNPLDLNKNDSAIIIGNGPSLLFQKKGKIIDSFKEVFRFNKFAIKGFEHHVGSKTTVWCTLGKEQIPTDDDIRPKKILYVHGNSGNPAYEPEKIWRIPLSFYYDLRKKIKEETLLKDKVEKLIPSSGVLVISWLLENLYDSVYIAGLDNFSKDLTGQHHYWVKKIYSKPAEHDGDWERSYIKNFINQKKVKVL